MAPSPGIITVDLSSQTNQTPLGIILAPLSTPNLSSPTQSNYTIVVGWTRPYNKLGLIQTSGMVRIGDRLVFINGVDVRQWTFDKIISVLRCFGGNVKMKSLSFQICLNRPARGQNFLSYDQDTSMTRDTGKQFKWSYASRKLYLFQSSIRSYSKFDDSYWKYEVNCRLFVRDQQGHENEITWSVWKRFSEFHDLHYQHLIHMYGWQLKERHVAFPSHRVIQSMVHGILYEGIAKQRLEDLKCYWKKLSMIADMFEFGDPSYTQRYAKDMASFLNIERYLFAPSSTSSHDQLSNSFDNLEISTISQVSNTPKKVEYSHEASLILTDTKQTESEMKSPELSHANSSRYRQRERKKRMECNMTAFQRRLLDQL